MLHNAIICNYTIVVGGIRFEWDEAKNLANQRKHGVSFEDASEIFRDPLFVSLKDRIEDGEQRWQTLWQGRQQIAHAGGAHRSRRSAHWRNHRGDSHHLGTKRITKGEKNVMQTKMVSYTLETLPPMTEAQMA